jgi:hypothetical protein
MKTKKVKRTKTTFVKFDSIEQFTESYFPSFTSAKKHAKSENDENYGSIIAMSILDGIKRDLSASIK